MLNINEQLSTHQHGAALCKEMLNIYGKSLYLLFPYNRTTLRYVLPECEILKRLLDIVKKNKGILKILKSFLSEITCFGSITALY